MANRHLSRSLVLQALFEWDFMSHTAEEARDITKRDIAEFAPGLEDEDFVVEMVDLVLKKKSILDDIIEKAAPEWPIAKINVVDRNVLRIGLTELLFAKREDVPPKVAINEAIELAKTFGGENSGRFINGVLGAVYRELGEPGKEDGKKNPFDETDPAKFPVELKAGGLVYAEHDGKIMMAFVHDVFGYWTFPKGSIQEGENEEGCALRKIKDEIGIDGKIEIEIGRTEYIASHPEQGRIRKIVVFYLVKAPYGELELKSGGGLNDARWFSMDDVPELTIYDDLIPMITKAIKHLHAKN